MAQSQTYSENALVLRKTKLGESDLIISFLAEDGSQIRAVAKGARKPSSSFATRLELFSVVKVLFVRGRSLDIVKEVRLIESNERIRLDMEHAAAAAPMVEILDKITQEELENPQLFALTQVALASLARVNAPSAPRICAAHLLKVFAFSGLRPSFCACVGCGSEMSYSKGDALVPFSFQAGGALCHSCSQGEEIRPISWAVLSWSHAMLMSPFSDVEKMDVDQTSVFSILRFCQAWTEEHLGVNLKSLNFMFTSGLY